jgi:hypothetical protein
MFNSRDIMRFIRVFSLFLIQNSLIPWDLSEVAYPVRKFVDMSVFSLSSWNL